MKQPFFSDSGDLDSFSARDFFDRYKGWMIAAVILTVVVLLFTRGGGTPGMRSMTIGKAWKQKGLVGNSFFYRDGGSLNGVNGSGTPILKVPLAENSVVSYGVSSVYVLAPGEKLAVYDGETGKEVKSMPGAHLVGVEAKADEVCEYTPEGVLVMSPDLELKREYRTGRRGIAFERSPRDGLVAVVDAGMPASLKAEGAVSPDQIGTLDTSPELNVKRDLMSYKPEKTLEDPKPTQAEHWRLSWYDGRKVTVRVSSTSERFISCLWIDESHMAYRTDRGVYALDEEQNAVYIPVADVTDYAAGDGSLAVLSGQSLGIYDASGSLVKNYDLGIIGHKLYWSAGCFYVIGDTQMAILESGNETIENIGRPIASAERADGAVFLIYEDGIRALHN